MSSGSKVGGAAIAGGITFLLIRILIRALRYPQVREGFEAPLLEAWSIVLPLVKVLGVCLGVLILLGLISAVITAVRSEYKELNTPDEDKSSSIEWPSLDTLRWQKKSEFNYLPEEEKRRIRNALLMLEYRGVRFCESGSEIHLSHPELSVLAEIKYEDDSLIWLALGPPDIGHDLLDLLEENMVWAAASWRTTR